MPLIEEHYSRGGLTNRIALALATAGIDRASTTTAQLAPVDEFHIRGREATLELAERMNLGPESRVIDLGSGLGGPARTLAEVYGCHVTGVDLTPEFCETARELSRWTGLEDRLEFVEGDATALTCGDAGFDAAMTIHAAMNIAAKDRLYAEARRILKPGAVFAVYDVMQGEGGQPIFPVLWATGPHISHLATPDDMRALLEGAGFSIVHEHDSSPESLQWFVERAKAMAQSEPPPVSPALILGEDFAKMARNQVENLRDGRIRTVTFICAA